MKIDEIVLKFLWAGDKFMPQMHLKQPGFTYCICGPFTKNKERIQEFKEIGDMAYGDFSDLARRTAYDKVLRDKAFNIAKNLKYDGYQRGLASLVYKFFDKKSKGCGVNITLEFNEQLAKELHKPVIRN